MKFTLGNLILVFVLFWLLVPGNYHAYTHLSAGVGFSNCNHHIWKGLMMLALLLDAAILVCAVPFLLCADFWNKEIHLDKFDKK